MKTQIKTLIIVLCLFIPIEGMSQNSITYTYDSAGNRTGRSAAVQTLSAVPDNESEERISFGMVTALHLATPIVVSTLLTGRHSFPAPREVGLCPIRSYYDSSLVPHFYGTRCPRYKDDLTSMAQGFPPLRI